MPNRIPSSRRPPRPEEQPRARCGDLPSAELLLAVEQFNQREYFECHETLEEVWHGTRGPARDFFQGLIQISVGFYHLRNGNLRGGESQLNKGLARLSGYGERYFGLELADLRHEVHTWLKRLRDGELKADSGLKPPQYRYTPPPR
jgi:predicted metal-dependent hydrolase